jgi:hypothetical protein
VQHRGAESTEFRRRAVLKPALLFRVAEYRTFDKTERFADRVRPAANQLCQHDFFERFSANAKEGMNRLGIQTGVFDFNF